MQIFNYVTGPGQKNAAYTTKSTLKWMMVTNNQAGQKMRHIQNKFIGVPAK